MFTMTNDVCTLFFFLYMNHVLAICFSVYPHKLLLTLTLTSNLELLVKLYIYFITILYIFNEFIIFDLHVDTCILVYLKNT